MRTKADIVRRQRQRQTALISLASLQIATAAAGLSLLAVAPETTRQVVPEVPKWPTVTAGESALRTVSGGEPARPRGVVEALEPYLSAPQLGGSLAATVLDPMTGEAVFSQRADVPATPASTAKLATATAALASLGPDFRLTTRVVRGSAPASQGTAPPSGASAVPVILVGGGDPTLASPEGATESGYPESAELANLANATVRDLSDAGITVTQVAYDVSLFTGPQTGPGWKDNYVPEGSVSPVSALSVDGGRLDPDGRARATDPAVAAAAMFADLLERGGITVRGAVVPKEAPVDAVEMASVSSPSLAALVEHMLSESDNNLAEALARHVAIERGQPASFVGAADAVRAVLAGLGVAEGVNLVDGSGLSTQDRVTAAALAKLLALAASPDHPAMRSIITGLPIAGFSGTLSDRYDGDDARAGMGVVRAKTGTLNGVSSLAGVAYSDGGRILVFAFLADDVPVGGTFSAEVALDRLAAALAECGCG